MEFCLQYQAFGNGRGCYFSKQEHQIKYIFVIHHLINSYLGEVKLFFHKVDFLTFLVYSL